MRRSVTSAASLHAGMLAMINNETITFTKPFERGRPSLPGPKQLLTPKPMTVCTRCLQTVGPGINHPKHCTIKDRRQNIQDLVEQDPRGAEMAASALLKEKMTSTLFHQFHICNMMILAIVLIVLYAVLLASTCHEVMGNNI